MRKIQILYLGVDEENGGFVLQHQTSAPLSPSLTSECVLCCCMWAFDWPIFLYTHGCIATCSTDAVDGTRNIFIANVEKSSFYV